MSKRSKREQWKVVWRKSRKSKRVYDLVTSTLEFGYGTVRAAVDGAWVEIPAGNVVSINRLYCH